MNVLLTVSTLLLASQVFAAEPVPARYRLGSPLRNMLMDGSMIESSVPVQNYKNSENKETLLASGYVVAVLSSTSDKKRVTKFTYKKSEPVKPQVAESGACYETRFLTYTELPNATLTKYSVVILTEETPELAKFEEPIKASKVVKEHVTLGFLRRNKPLTEELRKKLIELNIPFFENLQLPETFKLESIKGKTLYAFKFVFAPFYNATSLSTPYADNKDALTNLADLTIFEADERLSKVCKDDALMAKITLLSQDLKSYAKDNAYPLGLEVVAPTAEVKEKDQKLRFPTRIGTHLVAPYRFNEKKTSANKTAESALYAPCYRINLSSDLKGAKKISKEMIDAAIKAKPMPKDAIVVLETGYAKAHWSHAAGYKTGFPTLELKAAQALIETYGAKLIAVDTLSLDEVATDVKTAVPMPTHEYLANKDVPVVVNVRVEDKLFPDTKAAYCAVSLLRTEEPSAAPVAFFALPEPDVTINGAKATKKSSAAKTDATLLSVVVASLAIAARM